MFKPLSPLFFFSIVTLMMLAAFSGHAQESATEGGFKLDENIGAPPIDSTTKNQKTEAPLDTIKRRPELGIGAGTMTQSFRKVQINSSGNKNNFTFAPYFSLSLKFPLSERFSLLPSGGITFPQTGRDENITKLTYYLLGEGALQFNDFTIKGGTGFSMNYYKGKGGEALLNNGNGVTSFTVPSGSSTTRNIILSLGAEYRFIAKWAAQLQTIILNPHTSQSRAVTYTLSAVFFVALGE